jgi:hypothetical protein
MPLVKCSDCIFHVETTISTGKWRSCQRHPGSLELDYTAFCGDGEAKGASAYEGKALPSATPLDMQIQVAYERFGRAVWDHGIALNDRAIPIHQLAALADKVREAEDALNALKAGKKE